MMGYLFNEDKTAETFDADGWLKSGDIAHHRTMQYKFQRPLALAAITAPAPPPKNL